MGMAKRALEEAESRGWWDSEEWVCEHCVDEPTLEDTVRAEADGEEECSFCGRSPAAPLDVLVEAFFQGMRTEYATAEEENVPFDSEEGRYLGNVMSTEELVTGYFGHVLLGEGLAEAVAGAMVEDQWVKRGEWAGDSQREILTNGWDSFCHALKHETRYVFLVDPKEDLYRDFRELSPSEMLAEVGHLIDRHGLYRSIDVGHRFWRARTGSDPDPQWGAKELGTPPREHAKQANRMNPAGIPMFYGATDLDTAIRESLVRTEDTHVTAAVFEAGHPLILIDLTTDTVPQPPEIFDLTGTKERDGLLFLHTFVRRLSEPIREKYDQVDYVPTQVLTEYLLKVHQHAGAAVDGLMYSSATTGRPCVVLNIPNSHCVEKGTEKIDDGFFEVRLEGKPHLAMDPHSVVTQPISDTYA
ncbi:HEPN-associated N-terminal domain-containing protein [Kitasatospora sp. NPDC094028]